MTLGNPLLLGNFYQHVSEYFCRREGNLFEALVWMVIFEKHSAFPAELHL